MCLAVVVVLGGSVRAQEPPKRDPDIEALVADSAALPAEFAADALMRLSVSPKVDLAWRREMLDEAFMRAYGAPDQYRRSSNLRIPADSRLGAQAFASATALTRVSLQVGVVQLMAVGDPARAVELFEWIDLNLAPGVCGDPLVPAVDDYYFTLSMLARTTFGADRAAGLRFLELYAWRAHLPSEMPALARAVQYFRPRRNEAEYLEGLLRLIFEGATADAPGFSSAALDIVSKTADLQEAHTAIGVSGSHVMQALRAYLVVQLNAPRCSDNVTASQTSSAFNGALERVTGGIDVKPIAEGATRPSARLGLARIDPYWQTADARRLHSAAVRLRGPITIPLQDRVRLSPEWRNQAERLLIDIDQWTGTREPAERDYFYQKAVLYMWLLDLAPPRPIRTRALRSFVDFLRLSENDRDRRTLWFAFVNRLLDTAQGSNRPEILAAMEDSHHPVLSLYARIERLGLSRRD